MTLGGRPDRSGRWLLLSVLAFALIAALLFVHATLADHEATLRQGWTDADNTAALVAEHADRALRVAEITTARVVALAEQDGVAALAGPRRPGFLALAASAPEIGSFWVLDAEGGLLTASHLAEVPPLTLAGRASMLALRQGAPAQLSDMFRGRLGKSWGFGWTQAIRVDGRLQGAVQAVIHGEDYARMAERLDLGPDARLCLRRADGALLMAWPLPETDGPHPVLAPVGRAGRREETGADGIARLVAWRSAPSMPVVAEAALSRAHVLRPFHARLWRNGAIFALSVLLAGGLAALAVFARRREAQARHAAEERGLALTEALAERVGLLASLAEGEARLRLAEQAGGLGLWDWDLRDRRLAVAGEVFTAFGSPGAGPRGFRTLPVRAALRAIHPEDRGALAGALAAALRRGTPFEAEFRLAPPAPGRWLSVRAEARLGVDGRPLRLFGIAYDVTARRREAQALAEAKAALEVRVAERTGALAEANARLREGEARFRGIFNATFQFIGLLSPDGTILEANEAMLRLGGATAGQVIGRPYWDAPWWPDDPATRALVREAVAEAAAGRFFRREARMRDAEGRAIAIDFSVKPVRDEEGLVSLLVPEARDVSDLKSAQALLLEAQKMDTLGQLTGGVAHDFNNLLMAVLGNLAVARRRLDGRVPEVLRHLDAATQAGERGALLTQRLLAFARRQDLRPSAVDLRALLGGMDALLRRSAGPLVTVEVEAPEGLPAADVDPHALELAVMNLAVNARDAMPEGGRLSVTLSLAEGAAPAGLPPGRWLVLAMSDTGHGMDEATLRRAVEPFFSTKGPGQGTGLGLSMVHGLAAQSGGALLLDSAPGAGTRAAIWLPASARLPAPARPAEAEPPRMPGAGAVLLVDDEALVLDSTAALLQELGFEVVPAASAEAALETLAARRDFAAVVTDHAMPGMTGEALAERIAERWPGLPVVLATGHAVAGRKGAGGPVRLAKPYGLAQLDAALKAAQAKARAA